MAARSADQGGTRTRLLRATLTIVGRDGVAAVTNRAVAAEAGVALGSLTYHFASQQELLRESLILFIDGEVERLRTLIEDLEAGSADDETTTETTARIVEVLRQSGGQAQLAQFDLYVASGRDTELREAVSSCYAAYEDVVRATLAAVGRPVEDAFVTALVAVIHGYELRRLALGAEPVPPLSELLAGLAEMADDRIRA